MLFDISHANSKQLIKNEEDRQFLRLERVTWKGCVDLWTKSFLHIRKNQVNEKKKIAKWLKEAASSQISNASSAASFTSTMDETETENKIFKEDFDDEYVTEITPGKK